jgi:hypothetical protein
LIALKILAVKHRFGSQLLVAAVILCVSSANATAIPLSEYHSTLMHVVADIESIIGPEDGHDTLIAYDTRLTEKVDAIRLRVPKNQQIESDKGNWTADNTWLHTAVDELQQASEEQRRDKLVAILERVRALDERVKDLESASSVQDGKDAAKQKLESILSRPEYASAARGPNALTRLIRDFIRWIQSWFPEPTPGQPGRSGIVSFIVQMMVVATALFLILYVGRLLFIRFRRPRKAKVRKKREARIVLGERLKPEDTATDLLAEAEALARSGDLRAAIRKAYIALLVELGDRNVISLAQYKTNRDYLRAVTNRPQLHSPLKKLTDSFERHWYGFAQATPNDWQDFRAGYSEALQTGN